MAGPPGERIDLDATLAEYHANGDPALRDQIVESQLALAEHLARRFAHRGEAEDDLVQVASLALIKAVDRFDPERGFAFSTFATQTILGELKRHFRDQSWAVRTPRRLQEMHLAVGQAVSALTQELGRSPSIGELASRLEATPEDVVEALEAGRAYRASSLDAPEPGMEESRGDRLGAEHPGFGDAEDRLVLHPLLDQLPERQQVIVRLRFYEGLTQSEIAARLGISQMHVSRLLARSLEVLRQAAGSPGEAPGGGC